MTNTKTNVWVLLAGLLAAAPASAQLPQASATALGMGYNMTAAARGFAAVANNPAGLAHWESPGFSLAIPAVAASSGLGPITLSDLADWDGQVVPVEVKDAWLALTAEAGGQSGAFGAGATPIALNIGPLGFQLSTQVGGELTLGADAVELLLYGNAGRDGTPRDFDLDGSRIDAFAISTAAISYGFRASDRLYLGATGKYIMGNGLVVGRDAGSLLQSDPISVDLQFPLLANRSENAQFDNGTGMGLDLGFIWEGPLLTLGASVQNVVNTFAWTTDGLSYFPGQAYFDQNGSTDDFEEQPADQAPADFLAVVDELTLKPVYSVGAMMDLPLVRIQADVRKRVSGGISFGPDFHAGVGAELTALGFLRPRAHLARQSDGFQMGGGASIVLGPLNLSAAAALRTGELEDQTLGMFTLSFGGN